MKRINIAFNYVVELAIKKPWTDFIWYNTLNWLSFIERNVNNWGYFKAIKNNEDNWVKKEYNEGNYVVALAIINPEYISSYMMH